MITDFYNHLTQLLNHDKHKEFEQMILTEYQADSASFPSIDICVYQQRPYTHAIIDIGFIGPLCAPIGHGYAKCNPRDEWNEDIGAQIAVIRAARRLFRKLLQYYT